MIKKLLMLMFSSALLLLLTVSCLDINEANNKVKVEEAKELFNFATTKTISLNIAYNVKNDYKVMFKVYSENPFERIDGQLTLNEDLNPIAAGFTTGGGNYAEKIVVASTVKEVYVYSYYIGVPHLLKTELIGESVFLTADNEIDPADELPAAKSRAFDTAVTYKSYTTWNSSGRIDEADRIQIDPLTTQAIETINKTLSENADNSRYALAADFFISERAEISIRYIDGGSAARSTFGYYCYKGNVPPANPADLDKIMIFPNAHLGSKGVVRNDAVQLKFYDKATGTYSTEFPSGYTLGFFVVNDGGSQLASNNKFIEGHGTFYSTAQYNNDKRTHTAVFDLKQNDTVVRALSFEDWNDDDYNDVMFSIQASPITAIGPVPEVLPDEKEQVTSIIYKGIIAFEDLWPSQGDFDLNDAVFKYESQIYIGEKDNKIIRTQDIFTLLWSGAAYPNGFGYVLNTPRANIESVKVKSAHTFAGQGLEPDADEAIVMLMDKANIVLGPNQVAVPVVVTTEFKNRISISELGGSPYNAFIVSNGSTEKNRKEIHLVDNKPSSKCDMSYFGTKDDISFPGNNIFYRTKANYPFAIQLPNIVDISAFLDPAFEGKPIDVKFPKYNDWVKSKGTTNKDWYIYPAK